MGPFSFAPLICQAPEFIIRPRQWNDPNQGVERYNGHDKIGSWEGKKYWQASRFEKKKKERQKIFSFPKCPLQAACMYGVDTDSHIDNAGV